MINADKCKAVLVLHQQGKSKREISKTLEIDRKSIQKIIKKNGKSAIIKRKDKVKLDAVLLENIYLQCNKWARRTHEVLSEEYKISVGYSTLTQMIRNLELKDIKSKRRCAEVEVTPGEEMQHDTSPYTLEIGGIQTRVQCSGLYYRYSKIRYIKFYKHFTKFDFKNFMYEALLYYKYSAGVCVIDNTNLAVLRGTGKNAIFHADMNYFARRFKFVWLAHEIGHSDRKGGKERNFYTVETNFIPGRKFSSMDDLNRQALEWATNRYFYRPHEKTKQIPAELFEIEKSYLNKLTDYVEAPYRDHERLIDRYGYVALRGNFYWIPGTKREYLKIIEYSDRIKIFKNTEFIIEYQLPAEEVIGNRYKPPGVEVVYKPQNNRLTTHIEEVKLRAAGECIVKYLDFIKSAEGAIKYRNVFIKKLYNVFIRTSDTIFQKAIERAMEYKINDVDVIERIIIQIMRTEQREWPEVSYDSQYKNRAAYLDGRISEEPDLSRYKQFDSKKNGDEDGSQ